MYVHEINMHVILSDFAALSEMQTMWVVTQVGCDYRMDDTAKQEEHEVMSDNSWHTEQQVQRNHLLHSVEDASLSGLLTIQLPCTGFAAATRRAARLSRPAATDTGWWTNTQVQTKIEKKILYSHS